MKNIFLFLIALVLASCAKVDVVKLSEQYPSKGNICALDIYGTEKEVNKEYTAVCVLSSTTGRTIFDKNTVEKAVDQARPKACQCGADAIIIQSSEKTTWQPIKGKGVSKVSMVAIKYKD